MAYSLDTKPTDSYSNDTKPSTTYTNDTEAGTFVGTPIGLLLALTYPLMISNSYTNDIKP